MTDEAPKEIWIEDEFGEGHEDRWSYGSWDCRNAYGYQTPYLLKSHALALVAEAYDSAFRAAFRACKTAEAGYIDENSRLAQRIENELRLEVSKAIKKLTPADAIAAREADRKQVREQALREAADRARRTVECCQSCASVELQILALIDIYKSEAPA